MKYFSCSNPNVPAFASHLKSYREDNPDPPSAARASCSAWPPWSRPRTTAMSQQDVTVRCHDVTRCRDVMKAACAHSPAPLTQDNCAGDTGDSGAVGRCHELHGQWPPRTGTPPPILSTVIKHSPCVCLSCQNMPKYILTSESFKYKSI